jgi:hypothetical protein
MNWKVIRLWEEEIFYPAARKTLVLAESVKHHIEQEEGELFPKLEGHLVENLGEKNNHAKNALQKHLMGLRQKSAREATLV